MNFVWAYIVNGIVGNLYPNDDPNFANDYPDLLILDVKDVVPQPSYSWRYDATTNTYLPPLPPPPPTPQEIIEGLRYSVTNDRLREAILGIDNGWLADVQSQIDAQQALIPPP